MPKVNLNGAEIYYEIEGSGRPIVFLAGMGLDLSIWYGVTGLLEDRFACVLMDNRGAGFSEATMGPYAIPQMAADVFGLMEGLGLTNVVVAGHSMGGCIAQQLALDHPDLVGGLVLLGTASGGRSDDLGSTAEAQAALSRTVGSPGEIVRGNMIVSVSPSYVEAHRDDFEQLVEERLSRRARGRGVAGQRAACAVFDLTDRLSEIRCPTLIIHGADDQIAAVDRGHRLKAAIKDSKLVVLEGVGHMPQWEAPSRVAEEIAARFS